MSEKTYRIGITQGDTNGIGWEVILKTFADPRMTELCTPVLYGSPEAAAYYRKTIADLEEIAFHPVASAREARRGRINFVRCGAENLTVEPGRATAEAGRAAVDALRRATEELKAGELDALVTAPFDKESVQSDDFRFTGHTEFFGSELEGEPMMIMCSDVLRVGLVTKHIGRTWQCGTIQLDFQLPQNFDLSYTDENNLKQRPIMLHRVCFGSVERFIGILTEHYAGKFPVWLAPVQAKVLSVSQKSDEYAREVFSDLRKAGIRCGIDLRKEKIGYMIREAQYVERIPYMLITGEKESADRTVSVRSRDSGKTEVMTLSRFIDSVSEKTKKREG